MFRYSWTYRLMAGSYFLGWLVSAPAEVAQDTKNRSVLAPVVHQGENFFLQWLYRCGTGLRQAGQASWLLSHWLGLAGLFLLVCGFGRLLIGTGLRIPMVLILAGLTLSMLQLRPRGLQGSWFLSLFHWWSRTD